jgi:hypothetical protein
MKENSMEENIHDGKKIEERQSNEEGIKPNTYYNEHHAGEDDGLGQCAAERVTSFTNVARF